ncbi:hypothetical protein QA612_12955 [Evansella sp. AB-P1]|uniref:hypothetical protein n=1 Tax=Evansella sp. AB-P1 TaxID=3037653 RepID=UPI00241FFB5B|nr:hypothetical protein [Evansella sp. AB-P1]MDG5788391.1 hypothetical protein [Evansella sp. AB-P1]
MSSILQDWKNMKGAWLSVLVVFYLLFLLSFLFSSEPRDLFYLNEMFMLPLVVICTIVFFQREFGGYFSEIYGTFPVSIPLMMLRKIVQLFVLIFILHFFWTVVYSWRFGGMETVLYSYQGKEAVYQEVTSIQLFLQALPTYFVMAGATILGLVLTKKVYGGLGVGFALWMFEVISVGSITGKWALFTIFLSQNDSFAVNRIAHIVVFLLLFTISIFWANRRSLWVIHDEYH